MSKFLPILVVLLIFATVIAAFACWQRRQEEDKIPAWILEDTFGRVSL